MSRENPGAATGSSRARRRLFLVVLFVLLVVAALIRFWPIAQPDAVPDDTGKPPAIAAGVAEPSQPEPKRAPLVATNHAPDPSPPKSRDDGIFKQHSPAPVRIVDREGKPMAGFSVVIGVYARRDLSEKSASLRRTADTGALLEAAGDTREYVTDDSGVVRVEIPSYGFHDAGMLVAARDWKDWVLSAKQVGREAAILPGVCALRVEKQPQQISLIATRAKRFVVPISFADGRPFSGKVHIMFFAGELGSATAVNLLLTLDDASVLTFEGIEGVKRGSIICTSTRVGFRAAYGINGVDDAVLNSLNSIVIPAVPPESQAGLVVDLTGLTKEDGWEFMLLVGTTRQYDGVLRWGKEYRTLELNPLRGPYRARLEGKFGQVWDSGPITPIPGEIIRLVPEIQEGCRVQCTVLSVDGVPLFPVFATISEQQIPLWELTRKAVDGFRRSSEGFAYGNKQGVVLLEGVPPNVDKIHVEAEGHERVAVPVALTPGQSLDLGEIRLGKASGVLTVKLNGFNSSKDMVAVLRGSQGKIYAEKAFEGRDQVKFDALPFREYRLLIGSRSGSMTTTVDTLQQPIKLSAQVPEKAIIFWHDKPFNPPPSSDPK